MGRTERGEVARQVGQQSMLMHDPGDASWERRTGSTRKQEYSSSKRNNYDESKSCEQSQLAQIGGGHACPWLRLRAASS